MQVCSRCLLNSKYRNIWFNKNGVCNYCITYDKLKSKLTDYKFSKKLLEDRFNLTKGKYNYDCLVGISGGKDSSYLAYMLKNQYGLKILSFTFDNGFLTDYAKENIRNVTKELGVEHFFYKPDWNRYKEFYQQAVLYFGYPCPVCAFSSYAFMNKIAFEKKIPFCVHGRSPAQMFKELLDKSRDPFLPFVANNLSTYNIDNNKKSALHALGWLKYLIRKIIRSKYLRREFYKDFLPNMDEYKKADLVPEFLAYFLYEKYEENKIISTLENNLNWRKTSDSAILSHNDCSIHDAAMYLYRQVFGYSLLRLEISVMIRRGEISRKEAQERIKKEPSLLKLPDNSMNVLCNKCGIKQSDLGKIIDRAKTKHNLIRKGMKLKNIFMPDESPASYIFPSPDSKQNINKAKFDFVRYSNCWEDSDILLQALKIKKEGFYLSIASAGDNSFSLVAKGPKRVIAIDINPAQLACVELKKIAFLNLSYNEVLKFLGIHEDNKRLVVYSALKDSLSEESKLFWDSHLDYIKAGIIHVGKFENYFRLFRKWVLPLVHSRKKVNQLLNIHDQAKQKKFYKDKWNTFRWRLLFKIFFSRIIMGRFGRDPEFFKYVDADVADCIFRRAEHALTVLPVDRNPYLEYILTGNFKNSLPFYLRRENFESIRDNLDKLIIFKGNLENVFDVFPNARFDGFNLSDIFEYMSLQEYSKRLKRILKASKSKARLVYWNMLADRKNVNQVKEDTEFMDEEANQLHQEDKAFFYKLLIVGEAR